MNTIPVQQSGCDCEPCPESSSSGTGPQGIPGTNGTNGADGDDGLDAFTTTSAGFTMPAVSSSVTVAVIDSTWMAVGQVVYVNGAGYFSVNSKPDATHASLTNLGYTGNVAPGTVVATSKAVSPGGVKGDTGANGSAGSLSPTTTKGDIIVDNGANSPASNVVRLAAGTNGQALVADSTQATGVKWGPITPNTVTNDNNIPRFDGVAGTPLPLQDSKLLITDDGAIQSTPSGGNARGSKAVDLQVDRAVVTQVASGVDATISGGKNNTASGVESVVAGGSDNNASGDNSSIVGGDTNSADTDHACVVGGINNTASGVAAFVGGGSGNVTGGNTSTVVGGVSNSAPGSQSFVGGGDSNVAQGIISSISGGKDAKATLYGQSSQASGKFSVSGDSQTSVLTLRNSTTNATPTALYLDGATASARLTIPDDTTWAFRAMVVARRTDANDESAAYEFVGCIDRNVGVATTALVGAVTKVVVAEDTAAWDCAITADAANGALLVTVTGEAAKTIRWNCRIELTEVTG